MKRIAIAAVAASALLVLGSAQAQQMTPWYGELGYTWLKVDAVGTSARPGVIRAILGYDLHPYFALEGMLGGGVTDDNKNVVGADGLLHDVKFKSDTIYGIWAKPKYDLGNGLELFGRLGWSHLDVKTSSSAADLTTEHSQDGFTWGAGLNYHFNPRMYVGMDWLQYSSKSNNHVDGITLSFGYRF